MGSWISCDEKLPDIGESVLISVGSMYVTEAELRDEYYWHQFKWESLVRKDNVKVWMPLPKPYKEQKT